MAEEPSLSYYLPIAGGRIIGFIPFPRVLVLCEMQSVSSRIWTRIAVFISYGDNDYTTGMQGTSSLLLLLGLLWTEVLVPVRIPSIDEIELFNHLIELKPINCVQMNE